LRRSLSPSKPRRRTLLWSWLLAPVLLLATAPPALASLVGPESGPTPNAQHISSLYNVTLYIALVIFVGVEGVLGFTLWRFRSRKGREAKQIHGSTKLEIGWTIGAAVVLVLLAIFTFSDLSSIRNPQNSGPGGLNLNDGVQYETTGALKPPDGRALNIQVNGQQYIWRYTYLGSSTNPDGLGDVYSYYQMIVPTNTTVILKIVSQDVVHSWWIPQLGGKEQAVPGYANYTWFKISKPGNYFGQCSFLCGEGHARMLAEVTAVSPAAYTRWVKQQAIYLAAADANAAKLRTELQGKQGAASVEFPNS
jgi:cytochrome c oxidase subunit 2